MEKIIKKVMEEIKTEFGNSLDRLECPTPEMIEKLIEVMTQKFSKAFA